jgi:hypothetical protein
MHKSVFFLFLIGLLSIVPMQSQVIRIPEKFDFMSSPDQYGISTLLRLYFEKYQYQAVIMTDVTEKALSKKIAPNEYGVIIKKKSNFFITRMQVVILDYEGNEIAVSPEGISREKEFRYAYIEAVRAAMDQFTALKNRTLFTTNTTESKPTATTAETQLILEGKAPLPERKVTLDQYMEARTLSENSIGLYVQKGLAPILVLYKTSSRDCFMVTQNDAPKGIFLYRNQQWFWEYYEENQLRIVPQYIAGL